MKISGLWLFVAFASVACLNLTPNVSTDFSEVEARAVLEDKIRDVCAHKKHRIPRLLAIVEAAEADPTTDHWIFSVEGSELLVFESGVVAGEYMQTVKDESCR